MYIVRVRIGHYHNVHETSLDFATLYRMGRSLVKCGKRNHYSASFIIADAVTGKSIVRFYSMESKSSINRGRWVAAQSRVGKYHTHIYF